MNSKTGRIAVAVLAVGAIGVGVGGSANAAEYQPRAATAIAPANTVNSSSVVNNSLTGSDIKDGQIYQSDINLAVQNVLRTPGHQLVTEWSLAPSVLAKLNGPVYRAHWGTVYRNTIGSGSAVLAHVATKAPAGVGALEFNVASATAKAAYGNEVDFAGNKVKDIAKVGYTVFTTGENNAIAPNNMPSITFEVNPKKAGAPTYTSLVYAPDNSAANAWTSIDAVKDTGKHWGLTGTYYNAAADRCGLNGTRCTLAEVMAVLGETAEVLTLAVGKGRDYAWHGAVDNLVYNSMTFDFEPAGVK